MVLRIKLFCSNVWGAILELSINSYAAQIALGKTTIEILSNSDYETDINFEIYNRNVLAELENVKSLLFQKFGSLSIDDILNGE